MIIMFHGDYFLFQKTVIEPMRRESIIEAWTWYREGSFHVFELIGNVQPEQIPGEKTLVGKRLYVTFTGKFAQTGPGVRIHDELYIINKQ